MTPEQKNQIEAIFECLPKYFDFYAVGMDGKTPITATASSKYMVYGELFERFLETYPSDTNPQPGDVGFYSTVATQQMPDGTRNLYYFRDEDELQECMSSWMDDLLEEGE